ncbi:DUF6586 family protein [Pseudohaliea rubra]|uniref:PasA protein n=1 Tax=Pseudohaliea rubra DSM 19751 TaxID=1265313 RepID=A0A095XUK1_9GAMM|nr:DUF6586 family protein [Pseudohaliea rubra]KGE03376.1 hypothetical protein HRUBRA_02062 [Pseudohaliea rubra DSM 19751]
MSRGRANHHLYLARLLIDGWESQRAAGAAPAAVLDAAHAPGVREQLIAAYGWYLLAVLDPTGDPAGPPPRRCGELPEPPAGKAMPSEVREFAQLEAEGWLAELLAPLPASLPTRSRMPGNLITAERAMPDSADARRWYRELLATLSRMNDSLEES